MKRIFFTIFSLFFTINSFSDIYVSIKPIIIDKKILDNIELQNKITQDEFRNIDMEQEITSILLSYINSRENLKLTTEKKSDYQIELDMSKDLYIKIFDKDKEVEKIKFNYKNFNSLYEIIPQKLNNFLVLSFDKKVTEEYYMTIKPVGFIYVKDTETEIGCSKDIAEDDQKNIHKKIIKKFFVSKKRLTNFEWKKFNKNYDFQNKSDTIKNVSWNDAINYCNWLSKKQKLQPYYKIKINSIETNLKSNGYRLLTEEEWEVIAKNKNINYLLQDFFQNKEWCFSTYKNYRDIKDFSYDRINNNIYKVVRGGGKKSQDFETAREGYLPDYKSPEISFRIVKNIPY